MADFDRQKHWENLYRITDTSTKSWYQSVPETSLSFFEKNSIPPSARIIDVGGGDTFLVDHLLHLGYQNITVLDISATAIEKTKKRLGENAEKADWIVEDIAAFRPDKLYDVWHDRATFHFLTQKEEIDHYIRTATRFVRPGGRMMIGTFSTDGPEKCSGIPIRQYTAQSLSELFSPAFEKIGCEYQNHRTPGGSLQNFVFCSFRRKKSEL